MYGAEPWTWTKTDISTLTGVEMQFLSHIEGKPKKR
jgi:hypothetical protein